MSENLANWSFVANLDDIPNGKKRCYTAGDISVVVCRVYNEVYIVRNLCPHLNKPIAEGRLQEFELTCAYHNACFDIRNGKALSGPSVWPLETFRSRVVDGEIYMSRRADINPDEGIDPRINRDQAGKINASSINAHNALISIKSKRS